MKVKLSRSILMTFASFMVFLLAGCPGPGSGSGGGNNPPDIGFFVRPDRHEVSQTTGSEMIVPTLMRAEAQFIEPQGTIQGSVEYFVPRDVGPAATRFENAKVPAKWRITYVELPQPGRMPCQDGIVTVYRNVHVAEIEPLPCYARVFPVTLSPNAVDSQSQPVAIEIDIDGVSDEFGSPQVAILNEFGQLKATASATIIANAKHRISFALPSITQFRNGIYTVSVNNVKANGSWDVIGTGQLSIYGGVVPDVPTNPDPCAIPQPCLY